MSTTVAFVNYSLSYWTMATASQLLEMKPSARCTGLERLAAEARNLTTEEQQLLVMSPEGSRVVRALTQCKAIIEQAKNEKPTDKEKQKRHAQRYSECLAHFTCPERRQAYNQCWQQYARQVDTRRDQPMDKCLQERQALERCVGGLLSSGLRDMDASRAAFESDFGEV